MSTTSSPNAHPNAMRILRSLALGCALLLLPTTEFGSVSALQPQPNGVIPVPRQHGKTALRYADDTTDYASTMPREASELVGQVIMGGKYVLTGYIPVPSPKCEIYKAYPLTRSGGIQKNQPLIVKLSNHVDGGIEQEYANYEAVLSRLPRHPKYRDLFVNIYDKIAPSPWTDDQAGIVMERGLDNLRSFVHKQGAFRGEELRSAIQSVIECVHALHSQGLVWTELKPENFVVVPGRRIKGIDLESLVREKDLLKVYTAEACPPEFPVDEMYKSLPEMVVHHSFDIWGLGLVLFEMATGKPFYAEGLTDLEFIKHQLRHPASAVQEGAQKLRGIDPQAAELILACLRVNPRERPSTRKLLEHPYFSTTKARAPVSSSRRGPQRVSYTQNQPANLSSRVAEARAKAYANEPRRQQAPVNEYFFATVGDTMQENRALAANRPQSIVSRASAVPRQQGDQRFYGQHRLEQASKRSPVAPTNARTKRSSKRIESRGGTISWRDQLEDVLDTMHNYAEEDPDVARDLSRILGQAQMKLTRSSPSPSGAMPANGVVQSAVA